MEKTHEHDSVNRKTVIRDPILLARAATPGSLVLNYRDASGPRGPAKTKKETRTDAPLPFPCLSRD